MGTVYAAVAILGMSAIVGMYLLSLVLRSKTTPTGVAVVHGLMAVVAVILLVIYSLGHPSGPWTSIIIFLVAATGGVVLGYKDLTTGKVPKWLAIVHGLVAVIGFVILLIFIFN